MLSFISNSVVLRCFAGNEAVYGTANLLWVTGVMRMPLRTEREEAGGAAGMPGSKQPFTAWPESPIAKPAEEDIYMHMM